MLLTAHSEPLAVLDESEDEHLARNVRNFIFSRIHPTASEVYVEADRGIVTLKGRVGSFYHKQLWLSGTQRVAGVRRVIDEIHVSNRIRG
jgi:osmotically-inducible protein OsmY